MANMSDEPKKDGKTILVVGGGRGGKHDWLRGAFDNPSAPGEPPPATQEKPCAKAHEWTVVGEGADPEPYQRCACGDRTWEESQNLGMFGVRNLRQAAAPSVERPEQDVEERIAAAEKKLYENAPCLAARKQRAATPDDPASASERVLTSNTLCGDDTHVWVTMRDTPIMPGQQCHCGKEFYRMEASPLSREDHAALIAEIDAALPAINSVRMVSPEDGNTYEGESDVCDLLQRAAAALRGAR